MILVDTSIWIDHLRQSDRQLAVRLEAGDVVCHPFVIGELACGSLSRRHEILELLAALPRTWLGCRRCQSPDHRQSSALSTRFARNAFRST
jgi:predicted nucleic acid-binding protein